MTVATDKFFSDWYTADGVNKNWGFDFIIQLSTDAYIEVRNDTTNESMIYESGFSVVWNSSNLSSGYVTYPASGPAVAVGNSVRVVRDLPYTQTIQIGREGSFDPMLHERALDRLAMQIQQVNEAAERAIKVPLGGTGFELENIPDGSTLMKQGTSIVQGPNSSEIQNAQGYAEAAATSANFSDQRANYSNTRANASNLSAIDAATSTTLAQRWANEAENTPVVGGMYSAYHWAAKAAAIVSNAVQSAINAAVNKALLHDNDRLPVTDSQASYGLKSATLLNIIDSIFQTTRIIGNGQFRAATFKLFNGASTPRALMFNTTALTADRTVTLPDANVDLNKVGIKPQAPITPSGTAFTLSGIPAGVQRISLKFTGLLISAAAQPIMRLGTAGGVVSSGYVVGAGGLAGSGSSTSRSTTFVPINSSSLNYSVSNPIWGDIILTRSAAGSNKWSITGGVTRDTNGVDTVQGGVDLGAELTQIQITTAANTATFSGADAVAIEWEF